MNLAVVFAFLCAASAWLPVSAATWYVDATKTGGDGSGWNTAFRQIQNAISVAANNDTILVKSGTYAPVNDSGKSLHIESMNGAASTTIRSSGGGMASERCAKLSAGTELVGFTLENGFATDDSSDGVGAGAWGGTLRKCVIRDNRSDMYGGGAVDCVLEDCEIYNNWAYLEGGGVYNCEVIRCKIYGNSANYGGGAARSRVFDSLIVKNYGHEGAGMYGGTLNGSTVAANMCLGAVAGVAQLDEPVYNSIVWGNIYQLDIGGGGVEDNYDHYVGFYNSCTSPYPYYGKGNTEADPQFVNPIVNYMEFSEADYHLQANSPCIDAGDNADAIYGFDLDGAARIMGAAVDMGAYEYVSSTEKADYALNLFVTATANGSASVTGMKMDFNGDQIINQTDLDLVQAYYGRTDSEALAIADFNGDGIVDMGDLIYMLQYTQQYDLASAYPFDIYTVTAVPDAGYGVLGATYEGTVLSFPAGIGSAGTTVTQAGMNFTVTVTRNANGTVVVSGIPGGYVGVSQYIAFTYGALSRSSSVVYPGALYTGVTQQPCGVYDPGHPAPANWQNYDVEVVLYNNRGNYFYTSARLESDGRITLTQAVRGDLVGQSNTEIEIFVNNSSFGVYPIEILTGPTTTTIYVDPVNGNDANNGLTPGTAKQTLQEAIDAANDGDTVIAAPGTYDPIVTDNKPIRIEGSTDPDNPSIIDAQNMWGRRCATLGAQPGDIATVISGFTLVNGYSHPGDGQVGNNHYDAYAGGVYAGTVENCIIMDCSVQGYEDLYSVFGGGVAFSVVNDSTIKRNSAYSGGGSYQGTLSNCRLEENTASNGGGSYQDTLFNCRLEGNSAFNGGGAMGGQLTQCLIVDNFAESCGGGTAWSDLYSCTVVLNNSPIGGGGVYSGSLANTILAHNTTDSDYAAYSSGSNNCVDDGSFVFQTGADNIVADPLFVAPFNGDFHLKPISPCIGVGNTSYADWPFDFAGNPRLTEGRLNLGVYQGAASVSSITVPGPDGVIGTDDDVTIQPATTDNVDPGTGIVTVPEGGSVISVGGDPIIIDGISDPDGTFPEGTLVLPDGTIIVPGPDSDGTPKIDDEGNIVVGPGDTIILPPYDEPFIVPEPGGTYDPTIPAIITDTEPKIIILIPSGDQFVDGGDGVVPSDDDVPMNPAIYEGRFLGVVTNGVSCYLANVVFDQAHGVREWNSFAILTGHGPLAYTGHGLPDGLTLLQGSYYHGSISGTPEDESGLYTFYVKTTFDSMHPYYANQSYAAAFTIRVVNPASTITVPGQDGIAGTDDDITIASGMLDPETGYVTVVDGPVTGKDGEELKDKDGNVIPPGSIITDDGVILIPPPGGELIDNGDGTITIPNGGSVYVYIPPMKEIIDPVVDGPAIYDPTIPALVFPAPEPFSVIILIPSGVVVIDEYGGSVVYVPGPDGKYGTEDDVKIQPATKDDVDPATGIVTVPEGGSVISTNGVPIIIDGISDPDGTFPEGTLVLPDGTIIVPANPKNPDTPKINPDGTVDVGPGDTIILPPYDEPFIVPEPGGTYDPTIPGIITDTEPPTTILVPTGVVVVDDGDDSFVVVPGPDGIPGTEDDVKIQPATKDDVDPDTGIVTVPEGGSVISVDGDPIIIDGISDPDGTFPEGTLVLPDGTIIVPGPDSDGTPRIDDEGNIIVGPGDIIILPPYDDPFIVPEPGGTYDPTIPGIITDTEPKTLILVPSGEVIVDGGDGKLPSDDDVPMNPDVYVGRFLGIVTNGASFSLARAVFDEENGHDVREINGFTILGGQGMDPVTGGGLPNGLGLMLSSYSRGTIAGTPDATPGLYTFVVKTTFPSYYPANPFYQNKSYAAVFTIQVVDPPVVDDPPVITDIKVLDGTIEITVDNLKDGNPYAIYGHEELDRSKFVHKGSAPYTHNSANGTSHTFTIPHPGTEAHFFHAVRE